jgi:hypothetical protein
MRILSDTSPAADAETRRVVLCSGKVAYDLIEARDAAGITDTQIIRLEQLYPFPGEPLALRLSRMTNLEEVVWCQEEPKNNGSWFFVEPLIEDTLKAAGSKVARARYAGRLAAASPATGLATQRFSGPLAVLGGRGSGVDRDRLVLTSGASEANQLAIRGMAAGAGRIGEVWFSRRDHPSSVSAALAAGRQGWRLHELVLGLKEYKQQASRLQLPWLQLHRCRLYQRQLLEQFLLATKRQCLDLD